jgi:hypothetical protein
MPSALTEDRSVADAHNTHTRGSSSSSSASGEHKKASLLDKVNPKVDADGDGKRGFMK